MHILKNHNFKNHPTPDWNCLLTRTWTDWNGQGTKDLTQENKVQPLV